MAQTFVADSAATIAEKTALLLSLGEGKESISCDAIRNYLADMPRDVAGIVLSEAWRNLGKRILDATAYQRTLESLSHEFMRH